MCEQDSLEPSKIASHIFLADLILGILAGVKNKKESIDVVWGGLVNVPIHHPQTFSSASLNPVHEKTTSAVIQC
jgi:hypothetical protein